MSINLQSLRLPAHRGGECSECEGSGVVDYEFTDGPEPLSASLYDCDDCDGTGEDYWRWDPKEVDAECDRCHAQGVIVDGWGEDGEDWTCRKCALDLHKAHCGCGDVAWAVQL